MSAVRIVLNRVLNLVVPALISLQASHAAANLYKCSAVNGGVVYQDTPCAAGKELRNFDKDPPTLSVVPGLPNAPTKPAPPSASKSGRGTSDRTPLDRSAAKDKINVERAGERRFIRVGMTEAEVLTRIGRPEINGHKKDKRSSGAMQWSYLPNAGDPGTITTVTIVGGKVTDVQRKISR